MGLSFFARRRSVLDAVPWDLLVADGVLRNTDGALTAMLRYRCLLYTSDAADEN